jgi:hypothetical protein
MKRRPWPLIIIVWLHILAPIGNILINMKFTRYGLSDFLSILFSSSNITRIVIFIIVPPLAGTLIYICKKWSYIAYIFVMLMPVGYSLYTWLTTQRHETLIAVVISFLVNVAIVGYFMRQDVRKIYFDPRTRWWETMPRFFTDFVAEVSLSDNQFHARITNISMSGLFFGCDQELQRGDQVALSFLHGGNKLVLSGFVVYKNQGEKKGYGVKFGRLGGQKTNLRNLITQLEKDGAIVESRQPGPEDSFLFWLKSIFSPIRH